MHISRMRPALRITGFCLHLQYTNANRSSATSDDFHNRLARFKRMRPGADKTGSAKQFAIDRYRSIHMNDDLISLRIKMTTEQHIKLIACSPVRDYIRAKLMAVQRVSQLLHRTTTQPINIGRIQCDDFSEVPMKEEYRSAN